MHLYLIYFSFVQVWSMPIHGSHTSRSEWQVKRQDSSCENWYREVRKHRKSLQNWSIANFYHLQEWETLPSFCKYSINLFLVNFPECLNLCQIANDAMLSFLCYLAFRREHCLLTSWLNRLRMLWQSPSSTHGEQSRKVFLEIRKHVLLPVNCWSFVQKILLGLHTNRHFFFYIVTVWNYSVENPVMICYLISLCVGPTEITILSPKQVWVGWNKSQLESPTIGTKLYFVENCFSFRSNAMDTSGHILIPQ